MKIIPGARCVVTGAGSGLGRAFCEKLAGRGARVLAVDVSQASVDETVALLRGRGADARAAICDVRDAAAVEALAADCDDRWGGTDLVVNNAGVAAGGFVGETPLADWRWVFDVNVLGVVHGCHSFVPRMKRARRGAIMNVASGAALFPLAELAPYCASKAAVVALSEALYAEVKPFDMDVTVVLPGFFASRIEESARGGGAAIRALLFSTMESSRVQAPEIAERAIRSLERGELYAIATQDVRNLWRLKRASPQGMQRLLLRLDPWLRRLAEGRVRRAGRA